MEKPSLSAHRPLPRSAAGHQSPWWAVLLALRLTLLLLTALLPLTRLWASRLSPWQQIAAALPVAAVISAALSASAWHSIRWQRRGELLIIKKGIIFPRQTALHRRSITRVELRSTPAASLLGCRRLCVSGAGGLSLLLSGRDCLRLAEQLRSTTRGRTHFFRSTRASLNLSALGSALGAVLLLSPPLVLLTGQLFPSPMPSRGWILWGAAALPPLAALLLRRTALGSMSHQRQGDTIILRRGTVCPVEQSLCRRQLCGLDTRFFLSGLIPRLGSCALLTPDGRRLPYLPTVPLRRLSIEGAVISPHSVRACTVLPCRSPVAYSGGRWAQCLLVLPALSLLRRQFPADGDIIVGLALWAALLLVWRGLATTLFAHRSGMTVYADSVELTAVSGLSARRLRVFRPSLGIIRITRTPFSLISGQCTVKITPAGRATSLRCIGLPFDRTLAAAEKAAGSGRATDSGQV